MTLSADCSQLALPPPPYTDYEYSERVEPEEIWTHIVVAAYYNQTESPLLWLPDACLALIMEFADLDDLLRLRHACRDFMRIFSESPLFSKYRLFDTDSKRYKETARVWAAPSSFYPNQVVGYYNELCDKCAVKRLDDPLGYKLLHTMPLLYCSVCKIKHREMHFSPLQRIASNGTRACLGYEGYFAVCQHQPLSWYKVRTLAQLRSGDVHSCSHKSHKIQECVHNRCKYTSKPTWTLSQVEGDGVCITTTVDLHVDFRRDMTGNVNAQQLFEEICRRESKCDAPLLPSKLYTAAMPIAAFDPNFCSCLDWAAEELQRSCPVSRGFKWKLCKDPMRSWRDKCTMVNGYSGADPANAAYGDRCAGMRHGFTLDFTGRTIDVDFLNCLDSPHLLVMRQTMTITVFSPYDPGWADIVQVQQGEDCEYESDGTWCQEPRCGVYQQFWENRSLSELEKKLNPVKKHEILGK